MGSFAQPSWFRLTKGVVSNLYLDVHKHPDTGILICIGYHRQSNTDGFQDRGAVRPAQQSLPPEARPDGDQKRVNA